MAAVVADGYGLLGLLHPGGDVDDASGRCASDIGLFRN
jgi:hypothetical protein